MSGSARKHMSHELPAIIVLLFFRAEMASASTSLASSLFVRGNLILLKHLLVYLRLSHRGWMMPQQGAWRQQSLHLLQMCSPDTPCTCFFSGLQRFKSIYADC